MVVALQESNADFDILPATPSVDYNGGGGGGVDQHAHILNSDTRAAHRRSPLKPQAGELSSRRVRCARGQRARCLSQVDFMATVDLSRKPPVGSVDSLTSKIDALLVNAKSAARRRSSGAGGRSSSTADDARAGSGTPGRSGSNTPGRAARPESNSGSAVDGQASTDRSGSPSGAGFAPTAATGNVPAPMAVSLRASHPGGAAGAGGGLPPPSSSSVRSAVAADSIASLSGGGAPADESPRMLHPVPASALDALIEQASGVSGDMSGMSGGSSAMGPPGDMLLVSGPDGGVVAVRTMGASYAVQVRARVR